MVQNLAFGAYHAEQRFLLLCVCSLFPVLCTLVLEQAWQLEENELDGRTRLQHGYSWGCELQHCQ